MNTSFVPELSMVRSSGSSVLAALFLASSAFAADVIAPLGQQSQPAPVMNQAQPGFSPGIGDIVKMLDAKVDPEVVLAFIKASPIAYNPSAEEIIALKQRGVPDEILAAVIDHGAEVRAQGAAPAEEPAEAPAASYVPPTTQSSAPPYVSSPVPDYSYDYGYPGYPSASYWDGWPSYYPSYVGVGWGYPWYGSWWWYNYWYPSIGFCVPFYYNYCGYHHYPYYCSYYGNRGYYHNGDWGHSGYRGYGHGGRDPAGYNSRGTRAGGQGSPVHGASPYTGYRGGYARSAPSTVSARSARTATPSGSFAARQTFSGAPNKRQGPYSTPGAYSGSGRFVRGSGGVGAPTFTRSMSSPSRFAASAPAANAMRGGSFGMRSGYSGTRAGSFGGAQPRSFGAMRGGSFGGAQPRSFGAMRGGSFGGAPRGSFGGVRGGSFGGGGGGFRGGGGGFGGGHGGGRR